jgi:DNA polymerase I-like protein with 3'-5' exonuclease and polymerase domains
VILSSGVKTEFVEPALKALDVDYQYRMLIHDEVVLELPADEAPLLVSEVILPSMTTKVEEALFLTVPLNVEYNISREWAKP